MPGHSGVAPNEVVDFLSKHGAHSAQGSCGLQIPQDVLVAWLSDGAPRTPWVGVAIRSVSGDRAYPPLNSMHLGDDTLHGSLSPADLIRPFAPLDAFAPPAERGTTLQSSTDGTLQQCVTMRLTVATYNTLSLLGEVDRADVMPQDPLSRKHTVGRAAILAAALDEHRVQIAFLQETRCQKGKSCSGGFLRYASGASRGQWGTEIWLKADSPIFCHARGGSARSVISAQAVTSLHNDPRRIFLRLCIKPVPLLLVALHGPHRATEGPLVDAFWEETLRLLQHFHKGDFLILGGDCNAAIGSATSEYFGDHAAEPEDAAGSALHHIARLLRLWGPATFPERHSGPTHTYVQKKSGRLCRPDFILLPTAWTVGQVRSYTAPAIHAAQAHQDHIAACVAVQLTLGPASLSTSGRRRTLRTQAFAEPAVRESVRAALESLPPIPWQISVHAHAAVLADHIQKGLSSISQAQGPRPKHAYLREASWALQRRLSRIRRMLSHRQHLLRRHALLACLKVWRRVAQDWTVEFLACPWVQQLRVLIATQMLHMRKAGQLLRESCRIDRAAYIEGLADQISTGPSNDVFAAYHKLLFHRRKKPYHIEPLPTILDAHGAPCLDMQARFKRWRDHFGALEAGVETSFQGLVDDLPASGQGSTVGPHPGNISQVPSFSSLQRVLAATKGGKAPGLDMLPPELNKGFPVQIARHLFPLLMKQVWRGTEAVGFKGGATVFFHKKRGPQDECGSYRAILLMSSLAKACHQCLRPALRDVFTSHTSSLQMGGRPGCSVTFGSHLLRAVTAHYSAKGVPTYILFADIASAFYCTVTQLVADADHDDPMQVLDRVTSTLNLSSDDRAALAKHLGEPSTLAQAQADPWLEHTASRISSGNWFVLQGDTVPLATGRGSRPGSSCADVLFALLVPRILATRDRLRSSAISKSEPPALPWNGEISLDPCEAGTPSIPVSDVIWADDIAVPRVCQQAEDVRAAVAVDTGSLADACGEYGLSLSFGEVKTACLASIVGKGSRAEKRHLYGATGLKGVIHALREGGPPTPLSLVASYKHLGVYQAPAGRLGPEVKYRIGQARAAFHEARRKVFKNRSISVSRKAHILEATVVSKLVQGAGSWPRLAKVDQQAFDATLWSFYRALLCLPKQGDQALSGLACCALVGLPTPGVVLQRARMQYLRQLVGSGPPELWAAVKADNGYCALLRDDLRWMYRWLHATTNLPDPDSNWHVWRECMRSTPGRFKGCLKRVCQLEVCRTSLIAALDGLHRGLCCLTTGPVCVPAAAADVYTDLCIPCRRAFTSRKAWAGHAARVHGYRSRAFLLGDTPLCFGCGRSFGTIGRLRRHLTVVPACASRWGSFTPDSTVVVPAHPLAPPTAVAGIHHDVLSPWDPSISEALLVDLNSFSEGCEDFVWQTIEEHIEPLAVLRATVEHWRALHPDCSWHAEVSENMLLLLDPSVSAEHFPKERGPPRVDPYKVPTWCAPAPLCFSLSGEVRSWRLESPPPVRFDLSQPTSVTLRSALALSLWAEAACRVLIDCVTAAPSHPVHLHCSGIWTPLPVLLPWFRALGFLCDESGFRSPV